MADFSCKYYTTESGKAPVEEFIESLDKRTQVKYFVKIDLLEKYGQKLIRPHSAHLEDGIYELRIKGIEGEIRILYFFYKNKNIILTNGFKKKTKKISRKEIEIAKKRRKVIQGRY